MAAAERRQFERIEKVLEIRYWTNRYPVSARISDISEGGIFIDTHNPLEQGTVFAFSFRLSDDPSETPVMGTGKVIWAQPMMGMGVRFLELGQEDRDRIREFIQNELSARPRDQ